MGESCKCIDDKTRSELGSEEELAKKADEICNSLRLYRLLSLMVVNILDEKYPRYEFFKKLDKFLQENL